VTDPALVRKKLALIEAYVHELRTLGRPETLRRDVREQRFTLHTLQLAAQAALDVASHVVSDEGLGEPATNRDLFGLLARHRWIDAALAAAKPGDAVLIAGKGHEQFQVVGAERRPFSDRASVLGHVGGAA